MNYLEHTAEILYHELTSGAKDPFDLKCSRIFMVSADGKPGLLLESPDIYMGLAAIPCQHESIGNAPLIAVETCGWASPLEEGSERPPSEHSLRRRVRLVVVANREGDIASAIGFSDGPHSVITSPDGRGLLADAFADTMRRLDLVQSVALPRPEH